MYDTHLITNKNLKKHDVKNLIESPILNAYKNGVCKGGHGSQRKSRQKIQYSPPSLPIMPLKIGNLELRIWHHLSQAYN